MTSSEKPKISALVVAHNEEDQLADCLERLAFADELVVVLDKCTDGSDTIAALFTDNIVEGSWDIEGERRNTGLEACNGDWIIEVDADERVSPELAAEIREAVETEEYNYYLVPFDNYVGGRLVRYGWGAAWGVSAAARLSRRGCKRWGMERIHPGLELTAPEGRLTERMIHYVDKDISDMILRLDRYTTVRARDLRQSGDIGSFGHNVRRIFSRFYKCYVGRKGYREGQYGFLIALFAGLYPILSYLKAHLEDR
ncbi:MAG: glycosyltransferase family 2 protein [Alphaproteobacteria bacterium]|jgi:glycosyltransferase involved in cell wall biosynthesis|nr:glycosyltransferase family 2 protein [Alphaproteobacteria bacterium]